MIARLLRELDSPHIEVRENALEQFRNLSPELLLRLVQRESIHWRRRRRSLLLRTGMLMSAPLALSALISSLGPDFVVLGVTMFPIAFMLHLNYSFPNPAHKSLATLLTEMQDPRFIGPAVQMLLDSNVQGYNDTMSGILRALKRMIPQLRADQAHLLTADQKRALLTLLQTPYADIELILSILKALEQVGDASAIPVVEQLAEQGVTKVRRAANECLPYLRQRAEESRQAQTLLRAVAGSQTSSEALLRPVHSAGEQTPQEHLLRPMGRD